MTIEKCNCSPSCEYYDSENNVSYSRERLELKLKSLKIEVSEIESALNS